MVIGLEVLALLALLSLGASLVNGGLGYGYSSLSTPLALLVLVNRVINPVYVGVEAIMNTVIGRLKKGDYRPAVIMEAYRAVIAGYYPKDKVMLSSLSITMRYGGPKAAILLEIIRKNYGATHYIVGKD